MKNDLRIAVLGGDKRFESVTSLFKRDGYECHYVSDGALKAAAASDIIILPIPSFDGDGNLRGTEHTVYDLFSNMEGGAVVLAGKVPAIIKKLADEYKIRLFDYTENEEFNILNAVSTAEGAILTALIKTKNIVCGSRFTVLGYGKIGRALSLRLRALGGMVTVGARSSSARATAASDAVASYPLNEAIERSQDSVLFNTIPAPIIDERKMEYLRSSTIIDLASIPGGLTDGAKIIAGDAFIHALSLPGKCFPQAAGHTIYKTVKSILTENGVIQ